MIIVPEQLVISYWRKLVIKMLMSSVLAKPEHDDWTDLTSAK